MRAIYPAVIPHAQQRYDTCGDYYLVDFGRGVNFRISKMRDWRSEAAVFHHEFFEWAWCERNGVTMEAIDTWDKEHPDVDEPGEVAGCPYYEGHRLANIAEELLVKALGLTWAEHEENVADATKDWRKQLPAAGPAAAEG